MQNQQHIQAFCIGHGAKAYCRLVSSCMTVQAPALLAPASDLMLVYSWEHAGAEAAADQVIS